MKKFAVLTGLFLSATFSLFAQPCAPVPPGLIGWWRGESNANDVVNLHHGTLVSGATFTAGGSGFAGTAFNLDGINDYVNLGTWNPGSRWTLEAWVRPSSLPAGRRTIVGGLNQCLDWGIVMQDGVFGAAIRQPGGCSQTVSSGITPVVGQWYFLAVACDGTNASVYVDGQFRASAAVEPNYVGTTLGTYIGAANCCGEYFPGAIDEVSIYNRSLGATEIQSVFNAGASGKCTNLIAPGITSSPQSILPRPGTTTNLSVSAIGSAPLRYQWQFFGTNLPNATNSTLNLPNIQRSQSGPYQVVITNSAGALTSAVAQVTVLRIEQFAISIGDQVTNGIPSAGAGNIEEALAEDIFTFTASPGQVVYFDEQTGDSCGGRTYWRCVDPTGFVVFDDFFAAFGPCGAVDAGTRTLTNGGTYTITVYTIQNATNTYAFKVWSVLPQSFNIAINDQVTNNVPAAGAGNIETPGATDTYTFTASPGQVVYFDEQTGDSCTFVRLHWRCVGPTGLTVFDELFAAFGPCGAGDPGTKRLTNGGTYTITVYGSGDATGTYAFKVWSVVPQNFNIAINDQVTNNVPAAGAGNIETPGGTDTYAFTASPGQVVYFDEQTGQSCGGVLYWHCADSTGYTLFNDFFAAFGPCGAGDPGTKRLTNGGTYTITVYGAGDGTGSYAFKVVNVPSQNFNIAIGSTVTNGVPAAGAGNIETPGTTDNYTFTAAAGQRIYFDELTGDSCTFMRLNWRCVGPTGSLVFDEIFAAFGGCGGGDAGAKTLTNAGTYTITVYGAADGTGTYAFKLWNVVTQSFNIAIGDIVSNGVPAPGAGNIGTPGALDLYTFSVPAGALVYFDDRGSAANTIDWTLLDDTNGVVFTDRLDLGPPGNRTLTKGGTYTIIVQSALAQDYLGQYSFALLAPAPVITSQPESQTVIVGRTAVFGVSADSALPLRYQWTSNGGDIPGATNATLIVTNVLFTYNGTGIRVRVANTTATVLSDIAILSVAKLLSADERSRATLPSVPGNGVSIDLFNGIGGGPAPNPATLTNTPSGNTLSPLVDFPRPGVVVNVGNSFNTFFADTTIPPGQVSGLSAQNFTLRIETHLRISRDLDQEPLTPDAIDLQLGVGSDDGFHLTVGTNVLGSVGDRGFGYTWMPVAFPEEGLYPVTLLFSANAVGQSGLELAWITGANDAPEIIPQSALYISTELGDRLITFEELPAGATVSNQFINDGILFRNLAGGLRVTTNFPTRFVPVSPTHVLGDPGLSPNPGIVELQFVASGTTNPATSTFVSFFVIDAEAIGATVAAFDPNGAVIFTNQYHGGVAAQELVVIQHPAISRVRIELGFGADSAAIDNIAFTVPTARPDLQVLSVSSPANALPGQIVPVVWAITNRGSAAAIGPWTDVALLSTDAVIGGDVAAGAFTVANILQPGASLLVTQQVTIPIAGLSGNLRFVVQTDAGNVVEEQNESNNVAIAAATISVPLVLTLQSTSQIVENAANSNLTVLVTRNGNTAAPLTVELASTDDTELTVPAMVTIPPNQSSARFDATVVQDGIADGDQFITLIASANGYSEGLADVLVLDSSLAPLSLSVAQASLPEGSSMMGTVTRAFVSASPLSVELSSSSGGQLGVPASVVIPANQTAATFLIEALDDGLVEGPKTYSVSATATGHVDTAMSVQVLDRDTPALSLTLAATTVSEGAGSVATTATLSRDIDGFEPLVVLLQSSRPTRIGVPASVTFAPGQESVSFPVSAIENTALDGDQAVTITAHATETVSGAPIVPGASANLTVTDNDGPALTLTISRDLVGEGISNAATAILERNTGAAALVVQLSSSDTNELRVQSSVTIPANQMLVTFPLHSVNDGVLDGNKSVTIVASANGFSSGSDVIVVTDTSLPDLVITSVTVPSNGVTEANFNVSYREMNLGLANATGTWAQAVFISSDPYPGNDELLGVFNFNGTVPPGLFFERTLQFRLPKVPGDYWIVVNSDPTNQVEEALENNNVSVSPNPIHVDIAYTATVRADLNSAVAGTPVPLSGNAARTTGGPAQFELVNIHVNVRGTKRVISAITDEDGTFGTLFLPLPGEAGLYTIGAAHPGLADAPVQDSFTLFGMKFDPVETNLVVIAGTSVTNATLLRNLSEVALSGLTATVLGAPPELNVQASVASSLPGNGAIPVEYRITSLATSQITGTLTVRVNSAQGAVAQFAINTTVLNLQPKFVSVPGSLAVGMVRGEQTIFNFQIVNAGGATSGPVNVLLPPLAFAHLVTPTPLPPLAPGQTNTITLQLMPAADAPLSEYRGALVVSDGAAGVNVPFYFRTLSDGVGDLLVEATDEYTYYAAGSPRVANAMITLRDAATGVVVTNGVTDAQGLVRFNGVREAYYDLEARAEGHANSRSLVFVAAGQETRAEPFLSRQTVRYVWTVEPVEIEDRTRITLETVFETFVPIPVLTVEPAFIDLDSLTNDVTQINLTIRNHGLISALGAKLNFTSDSQYRFTPLISDLGDLPARSTLIVPLIVQRLGGGGGFAEGRAALPSARRSPKAGCASYPAQLLAHIICKTPVPIAAPIVIGGGCIGEGEFRPFYPVGTGFGDIGAARFDYDMRPATCECIVKALIDCGLGFTPIGDFADAIDCGASGGFDLGGPCGDLLLDLIPGPPGTVIDFLQCGRKIAKCKEEGQGGGGGGGGGGAAVAGRRTKDTTDDLYAEVEEATQRVEAMLNAQLAFFGSQAWSNNLLGTVFTNWIEAFQETAASQGSQLGRRISASERTAMLALPLPEGMSFAEVAKFVDRWDRTVDYHSRGIFSTSQVPLGQSTDFMSLDVIMPAFSNAVAAAQASKADGFDDSGLQLHDAISRLRAHLGVGGSFAAPAAQAATAQRARVKANGEGVCARVKLRIEQEAVITRDAFRATLELINSSDDALENVEVTLVVKDENGVVSTTLFGIAPPELSGLSGVDGAGVVSPNSTGKATWTLIPTDDAAPVGQTIHFVSGTLRYTQAGNDVTVPLADASITVLPNASLTLKYFNQRDVLADDPFTDDIVEPSVPYSLAILIQNTGRGTASNMRITSSQPEIIENEKGLLIDFDLIATEVEGQNLTPSLTANFGDIEPGGIAIGRWLFKSTLQGQFIQYTASFQHLDGLGDERLSLIDVVEIHELIRIVRATGAYEDGLPDFLANDFVDPQFLPDTLHLSDGSIEPVNVLVSGNFSGAPSPGQLSIQLTTPAAPGWVYFRLPDPGAGNYRLVRVLRSDMNEVPFGENAWTTDRTFIAGGRRPVYEHNLHIFDRDSDGSYTLLYESVSTSDTIAPSSTVAALPMNSQAQIPLQWSGQDNANGSGVAFFDIFVSVDNGLFAPWLIRTPLNGAVYVGEQGSRYAFYSIATDANGNREGIPQVPDAATIVSLTNTVPSLLVGGAQTVNEGATVTIENAASDGDIPANVLTFSLAAGSPAGATINPNTGRITWITGEGTGPSTNVIGVIITDNGSPTLSVTGFVTVIVNEVNVAPILGSVARLNVNEGSLLQVAIPATDADLPANNLTFALQGAVPAGAAIDPLNGIFTWTPTPEQGPSTNNITVVATDNGVPSLSATQTLTAVVRDSQGDFLVSLGKTNLFAGESGSVPLHVASGADLSNIVFQVDVPLSRLSNLLVQATSGELLSAGIQPLAGDQSLVTLQFNAAEAQSGTRQVAQFGFTSVSNQSSAIVSLRLSELEATRQNGVRLTNGVGVNGRVIIVAGQPLLEMSDIASVLLYGRIGSNYLLQSSTNLTVNAWSVVTSLTQTGRVQRVPAGATVPAKFFRVLQP